MKTCKTVKAPKIYRVVRMVFTETPVKGAFVIELEPQQDNRGFFARVICAREFATHGLNRPIVQAHSSFTRKRGTLRRFQLSWMKKGD